MKPFEVFFTALYRGQTGVLELRTFGPERHIDTPEAEKQRRASARLRDFIPVETGQFDAQRVQKFLDGCEEAKLGAFFGVALRTRESIKTKKGDTEHCQTLTALFVDADYKHLGEEETRRRIASFPLPPNLMVCSGGGLHPYWVLETPLYLKVKGGMVRAKTALRNIARAVAGVVDESVSEPIRVLRVPGSYNFKKEYVTPREVTLEIGPDTVNPFRVEYTANRATEIMVDSFKLTDEDYQPPDDWSEIDDNAGAPHFTDDVYDGEVPES